MVPQMFNLLPHLLKSIAHMIRLITNRKIAFYCIYLVRLSPDNISLINWIQIDHDLYCYKWSWLTVVELSIVREMLTKLIIIATQCLALSAKPHLCLTLTWWLPPLPDESLPASARGDGADCELVCTWTRGPVQGPAHAADGHPARVHEHQPRGLHRLCQVRTGRTFRMTV